MATTGPYCRELSWSAVRASADDWMMSVGRDIVQSGDAMMTSERRGITLLPYRRRLGRCGYVARFFAPCSVSEFYKERYVLEGQVTNYINDDRLNLAARIDYLNIESIIFIDISSNRYVIRPSVVQMYHPPPQKKTSEKRDLGAGTSRPNYILPTDSVKKSSTTISRRAVNLRLCRGTAPIRR